MAICHPEGPDASGKIFEVGAGYVAEVRWERSKGAVFKTDATFTPTAVCYVPCSSLLFFSHVNRSGLSGTKSATFLELTSEFSVSGTLILLTCRSPRTLSDIDSMVCTRVC